MEPAHLNLPKLDFTPPDQAFWPSSRYISIRGRGIGAPPTTTTTTIPTTTTTKPKKKPKPTTTTSKKGANGPTTTQPGGP